MTGTDPRVDAYIDALPDWHGRAKINAVLFDGAAGSLDREACLADLARPVRGGRSAGAAAAPPGVVKNGYGGNFLKSHLRAVAAR